MHDPFLSYGRYQERNHVSTRLGAEMLDPTSIIILETSSLFLGPTVSDTGSSNSCFVTREPAFYSSRQSDGKYPRSLVHLVDYLGWEGSWLVSTMMVLRDNTTWRSPPSGPGGQWMLSIYLLASGSILRSVGGYMYFSLLRRRSVVRHDVLRCI
jgi:hypothetical protein